MKRPIVVQDFQQMAYALKAGHPPKEQKKAHKGTWSVFYGDFGIEHDMPYSVCVKKVEVYKRFGNLYPNKEKFKIKPFLNK